MRRKRILGSMLYDNLLHNVILFICSALFAISMCEILYATRQDRKIIKTMMNSSLDNILYVVLDTDIDMNDKTIASFGEEILAYEDVELITETLPKTAYDYEHEQIFDIALWGEGLSENQNLDLVRGHMPQKNNQIVLCEDYIGIYENNQRLQLEIESFESWEDFNKTKNTVEIEIVGFYRNDSIIPHNGGTSTDFSTAADLFNTCGQSYAYIKSLVDIEGNEIFFNEDTDSLFWPCILKVIGGKNPDEVKESIIKTLDKYTLKVYTINDLRSNFFKSYKAIGLRYISTMVANITVVVITVFAYFYLNIIKKSKEMLVYYLFGMPWFEILISNVIVLLPGVILGDIFGFMLNFRNQKILLNARFYPEYLLITILFSLAILIVFLIPLFENYRKNNPIENMARANYD